MRWMLLVCLPAAGLCSVGLAQDAPAPRVGDVTVHAQDVLDRLVSDFGEAVLEELITARLVEQAAAAAGIIVSEDAAFERFLMGMGDTPPAEEGGPLASEEDEAAALEAAAASMEARVEVLASEGLTLDVALRRARIELLADALIGRQVQVTEEDIAKLFEEQRTVYGTPERRLIAHLVYEQENEAHRGADELRRGARVGQDTRELKYKPADLAEAALLDVVVFHDLTTPSQVSQPIPIDGGWHVIQLESILPAQEATLEECYDLLHGQVLARKSEALRRTWLQDLREKAGVDIRVTFR